MDEVYEMYERGVTTRVTKSNLQMVELHTSFHDSISLIQQQILCDPQTSGGLLVALPDVQSKELLMKFNNSGIINAKMIGRVLPLATNHLKFL